MKKTLLPLLLAAGAAFGAADFRIRDPFILPDGGRYYLYQARAYDSTAPEDQGVNVRTSDDLATWSTPIPVMTVPPATRTQYVWAPEVHKFAGRYWLFVTLTQEKDVRAVAAPVAGQEKYLTPRGTWVYKADAPTGPFVPVKDGPVTPPDWMTLDGTLLVDGGRPYMVFCREWCQMENGQMCAAPLADGFASFTAAPTVLFTAREAMDGAHHVTDGPYFHRSAKSGALYMIWSNFIKGHGYCVLVRTSPNGTLAGPWSKDEILYGENGGHGMIFTANDGRLMLPLHRPNNRPDERLVLLELADDGQRLSVVGTK